MAFVPVGVQSMNVTFEDRDVNQSTISFYVPAAAVVADAVAFATGDLVDNLAALSDAFIRRVTLSQTFENDTYVLPPESSDVERKGSFVWQAADRTTSKNEIPSFRSTLVVDKTNTINITDPAVAAFLAMVMDTGLLDVYGLGNYRGVKLVDTKSAPTKIHRASSRG